MKILYLNYYYDFSCGVNFIRSYELINYFVKKGAQVICITPKKAINLDGVKNVVVAETVKKPSFSSRLFYRFVFPMLFSRDPYYLRFWVNDINDYLKNNRSKFGKIDVIYVNTQPYSLCLSGQLAKNMFKSKLVVDFHDPFYLYPYRSNLKMLNYFRKRTEEKYLKSVDLFVVNTPSAEREYKKIYPHLEIICFPNVISKMIVSKFKYPVSRPSLSILYGGSLYVGRDVFPILKAIRNMRRKVVFEVLGDLSFLNRLRYLKYDNYTVKEKLARERYLKYLREHVDIGVVLQKLNPKTNVSCVAHKTYEYLANNKAIVYIGPKGDNSELIKKIFKQFYYL